jgi:coniferyl-aldehyde dehydrogenase
MSTAPQSRPVNTPAIGPSSLRDLFDSQRAAFRRKVPDYAKRIAALKALEGALLEHKDEIVRATNEDFGGRSQYETLILELAPLVDSIRHAQRRLAKWMKPRSVSAGINFLPGRARIVYQPLGVVGLLGAWNYPTFLTLSPLVDAIAAGNHVMLKPSELVASSASSFADNALQGDLTNRRAVCLALCVLCLSFASDGK